MQTPYEILGIVTDVSDAEIKQAYLQQVKQNPPDRSQDKFQRIHDAYSAIKDHTSRLKYELFTLPSTDFNAVIDRALASDKLPTVDAQTFKKILQASIDDASLLNALTQNQKQ